jgi:hypothetical protein
VVARHLDLEHELARLLHRRPRRCEWRCAQRQFLLRPDAATNNAFLYCLIAAALRSESDVLLSCAMSNHYHAVIYDRAGRYPELIEHFHKLLARSQNALRDRWENLWSREQTCVVNLVDRDAVIDKLVYTASNPVADHLVDRLNRGPLMDAIVSGSANVAILFDGISISSLRRTTAGFERVPLANDLCYLFGDAGDLAPALRQRLTIDQLGQLYHVHRATAARSLDRSRKALLNATRAQAGRAAAGEPAELDSILRMIRSRLEVSLGVLIQRRKRETDHER